MLESGDTRKWGIRCGFYDSSGMWSGVQEFVADIPGVELEPLPTDEFGEPAARHWYVLDHEDQPFTAIDVDRGLAWRRDGRGERFDLMALYKRNRGRIDAVMKEVMPDVE